VLRLIQTLVRWEWPMRLLNPVMGDFNPFLPEYRADPYPFYRKLQSKHRVYVARLLGGATCVLPRYDDIVAVLGDTRFSVDARRLMYSSACNHFAASVPSSARRSTARC
jgi:hypothetical protein